MISRQKYFRQCSEGQPERNQRSIGCVFPNGPSGAFVDSSLATFERLPPPLNHLPNLCGFEQSLPMAPLTDRNDRPLERELARGSRFPRPLPIGRWADTQIAIGWSLPVILLAIVVAGWWLRTRPGNGDLPVLSGILAAAIFVGALWQAVVRLMTVRLLDGQPINLTIQAFGSWGRTADLGGWKRWLAGSVPPFASFVLAAWLAAMPPRGEGWAGIALVPLELTGDFNAVAVVTATVWVLFLQAIAQCLPLPGCHGREAIAGFIETVGEHWQARTRRRIATWVVGLVAIAMLGGCLWSLSVELPSDGVPRWPFLALLSGACWASRRLEEYSLEETHRTHSRWSPSNEPLFGSRSPGRVVGPGNDPGHGDDGPPATVWRRPWTWYQQRQATRRLQTAHQRERKEAIDAARLDGILDRLHTEGLDALTADEKAVLRRVSDRLRKDHS